MSAIQKIWILVLMLRISVACLRKCVAKSTKLFVFKRQQTEKLKWCSSFQLKGSLCRGPAGIAWADESKQQLKCCSSRDCLRTKAVAEQCNRFASWKWKLQLQLLQKEAKVHHCLLHPNNDCRKSAWHPGDQATGQA